MKHGARGSTGEEGPGKGVNTGEGELDGCIMHRVHISLIY
jgi:hypothetical protein